MNRLAVRIGPWFVAGVGAALLALIAGAAVARGETAILGVFVAVGLVGVAIQLSTTILAIALAFAAIVQPPVASIGGIPGLTLAEVMVPLLLVAVAVKSSVARTEHVRHGSRAVVIAVALYGLVLSLNYVRTRYFMPEVSQSGPRRAFYEYFVALGAYLLFVNFMTMRDFDWRRMMGFLRWLAVAVSVLGLLAVLLKLPINLGDLRYSIADEATGAVRVGFLEPTAIIGLALAFSGAFRRRGLATIVFVAALLVSGGRTATIGAVVSVAVYLVLTRRSWQVAVVALVIAVGIAFVPSLPSNPQLERIASVNGQQLGKDGRSYLYTTALKDFKSNPLFGTGLGVLTPADLAETPGETPGMERFYESQLAVGGHATYTSLLKNFGLAGLVPFVAALLLALGQLVPRLRSSRLAGFFFIMLAAEGVSIVAGGNGADPIYFFALAGATAVLARTPLRSTDTARAESSSGDAGMDFARWGYDSARAGDEGRRR